jgi:hypothetical protein
MAIQLHLTHDEAGLLSEHLSRHLERLSAELVHTDRRELHHALAREIAALQAIADRLEDAAPSLRFARPPADVAR